jgi:small subunit ribosomal protein S20
MPNNDNARKAVRKSEKARLRNRAVKTSLRTVVRKAQAAAAEAIPANTDQAFRLAVKRLDQAASKGYIHRNKAARLKSRLAKRVNNAAKPAESAGA